MENESQLFHLDDIIHWLIVIMGIYIYIKVLSLSTHKCTHTHTIQ